MITSVHLHGDSIFDNKSYVDEGHAVEERGADGPRNLHRGGRARHGPRKARIFSEIQKQKLNSSCV